MSLDRFFNNLFTLEGGALALGGIGDLMAGGDASKYLDQIDMRAEQRRQAEQVERDRQVFGNFMAPRPSPFQPAQPAQAAGQAQSAPMGSMLAGQGGGQSLRSVNSQINTSARTDDMSRDDAANRLQRQQREAKEASQLQHILGSPTFTKEEKDFALDKASDRNRIDSLVNLGISYKNARAWKNFTPDVRNSLLREAGAYNDPEQEQARLESEQAAAKKAQYEAQLIERGLSQDDLELSRGLGAQDRSTFFEQHGIIDPESAKEQEIKKLKELGISNEDAINIAYGNTIYVPGSQGELWKINKITGDTKIVDKQRDIPSFEPHDRNERVSFDYIKDEFPAASKSFGVQGALAKWTNTVSDATTGKPVFPDIQKSQQGFNNFAEGVRSDVISEFAEGSRLIASIQRSLSNLVPEAGDVFTGPSEAMNAFNATANELSSTIEMLERRIQDKSLPDKIREEMLRERASVKEGWKRLKAMAQHLERQIDGGDDIQDVGSVSDEEALQFIDGLNYQ